MNNLKTNLITPHLEQKYTTPQLSHELSCLMDRILNIDKDNEIGQPSNEIHRFEFQKLN